MTGQRTTREWQQLDAAHHWHPFSDTKALNAEGSRVITRAEGSHIWDSDGNRILDGMAGLWCVNVGYGRKELVEVAYRQMQELAFYNSFFKTTHPAAAELAARIAAVAPPHMSRVFFTGSGSEANDTVLRLVRRYWDVMGQPKRQTVISRWNAYHGSTMAGASLGGMKPMHAQGGLPIPGIAHIRQPYWFARGPRPWTRDAFGLRLRPGAGGEDPRARARERRRVHRRAGAGCRRRDHPARQLLARDPADLPQVRHPAGHRRGDLRLRPARQLVRRPAFRRRARPDADRQGPVLGLRCRSAAW